MKLDEPKTYRWTRDKYDKMAEVGILKPTERVELLEGEIFVKRPDPKPRRSRLLQRQTDCLNDVVNVWSSSTINH